MWRKGDPILRIQPVRTQSGAGSQRLLNLVATYIPSSMMMMRLDSRTGIPSGTEILHSMEVIIVTADRDGADKK